MSLLTKINILWNMVFSEKEIWVTSKARIEPFQAIEKERMIKVLPTQRIFVA
jgi:hypothetical protein